MCANPSRPIGAETIGSPFDCERVLVSPPSEVLWPRQTSHGSKATILFLERHGGHTFLSTEIGGIRIAKIFKSNIQLEALPRTKNFIHEKQEKKVLKKINEFKLEGNKGCCTLGIGGSGKSTLCNKLQKN